MSCEADFQRADFLTFAAMHDIPIYHMYYAEFDCDVYEHAIVQFKDSIAALEILEHIHNLNVVCSYMVGGGGGQN
jgi:hypothetical protein